MSCEKTKQVRTNRPRGALVACGILLLATTWAAASADIDGLRQLITTGQLDRAVDEGRALLAELERTTGPDSLEVADVAQLVAVAMAGGAIGEKDERLRLAERALVIRQRRFDEPDPTLAWAYYTVGLVHNHAGDAREALPLFEHALDVAEAHFGPQAPELEVYVREYGTALYGVGRYPDAREVFERLDLLCREKYGAGHPGTIKAVFNLALVNQVLGDLEEAMRGFRQVLEILETQDPPDLPLLSWTLKTYAGLLATEGRLHEALAIDERVLEMRRAEHGPDSREVAGTLNDLGFVLRSLGDFEKARDYLESCLRIQTRVEVDPALALKSRNNLAVVLRELGESDAARAMFEEARAIGLEGFDDDHSYWGTFHREFGDFWLERHDSDRAREQYASSVRILTATVGEDHYELGLGLSGLGRVELLRGNLDGARAHLERAVEILDEKVGRGHPWFVTALDAQSAFYYSTGSKASAFESAVEAERAHRARVRTTLSVLPERQALAQAARTWHGRDVAVTVALDAGTSAAGRREAYDSVIRSRAVVFDEIAARQRFYRSASEKKVREQATRLEAARQRVANLFVLGPGNDPEGYADRMAAAQDDVERLEAGLARSSETYRRELDARGFGFEELSRHLPEGSACVSFVRYRRHSRGTDPAVASYAGIVQVAGKTAPRFVDLGPAPALERAIAGWKELLEPARVVSDPTASEARYRESAARLRVLLWDPVAPLVTGADSLYVVPEGAIHLVSLASLPVEGGRYLLERGPTLHYLTAERDLAAGAARAPRGSGLLALGDPAFDDREVLEHAASGDGAFRGAAMGCASLATRRFGPLPAAREEAKAVKAIWSNARGEDSAALLVGSDATEDALKRNAVGRSVLHLATHGFFLGDDCGPTPSTSRGIGGLSPKQSPAAPDAGRTPVNPLLLSGLALAGANRREDSAASREDGILTAEEVTALDLRGVQLAVLSACRTGAGTIQQGEGVFGLRRAFLVSGARVVVTNLWDVDDLAAREWITHLYEERFLNERSTAEAMRAASLEVLRARRSKELSTHPFYWAGWVAVGDPSS